MDFPSKYENDAFRSTGLLFIKVYNAWHAEIKKRLGNLGITHPQYVVMACIGYLSAHNGEVTQAMVSSLSEIDPMTVSQIVGLLEKKGLIVRSAHSGDSRAKTLSLSSLGAGVVKKATFVVEETDENFFGRLGSEEEKFKSFLICLKNIL